MKLFFAGAESPKDRHALYKAGVQNILMSYYYIKRRKVNIEEVLSEFPNMVVDSGAFTLMQQSGSLSVAEHEEFLAGYFDFLQEHVGKFYWVANYDVDILVGHRQVYAWNEKFEDLERQGQPVCYVAHPRDYADLHMEDYMRRYAYIGIADYVRNGKEDVGYNERAYVLAVKNKKRIHNFGMTNFSNFGQFPPFTCDSTTWIGGPKFGSTYVWNGAFFQTIPYTHKHFRIQYKQWCDKWGLSFQKFLDDDRQTLIKFAANAWLINERAYNRRTHTRQWWLSEEEKREYRVTRID
jgi:hypothetical protein